MKMYRTILITVLIVLAGCNAPAPTATPIPTPTPAPYETCPAWDPENPPYREPVLPRPPDYGVVLHPTLREASIEIIKDEIKHPEIISKLGIEGAGEATEVGMWPEASGLWFMEIMPTGPVTLGDGRELYPELRVGAWATFEDGSTVPFPIAILPVVSGQQCGVGTLIIEPRQLPVY